MSQRLLMSLMILRLKVGQIKSKFFGAFINLLMRYSTFFILAGILILGVEIEGPIGVNITALEAAGVNLTELAEKLRNDTEVDEILTRTNISSRLSPFSFQRSFLELSEGVIFFPFFKRTNTMPFLRLLSFREVRLWLDSEFISSQCRISRRQQW